MKHSKFLTVAAVMILFCAFAIGAGGKDYGIGPIKNFKLGEMSNDEVNKGKQIFNAKCVTCHKLDSKLIGPPLRNITEEQTPEFIMNLLLNTVEMQQKNAFIKNLIKEYKNVLMISPQLTQDQAKYVYEYLRYAYLHKPWQ